MNMDSHNVSYKNITSNIFLTSVYVYPPPSKFLSVTCSVLVEGGVWHFFIFSFLFYMITSYPRNIHGKKIGPTKYPWGKILNPQNTHETKFRTHEIPMRKNFGPTKYPQENNLISRNTHGKKIGSAKYSREKCGQRNTHKEKFWIHEGTVELDSRDYDGTRTTEFSTLIVWHTICFRLLTFSPAYGQL